MSYKRKKTIWILFLIIVAFAVYLSVSSLMNEVFISNSDDYLVSNGQNEIIYTTIDDMDNSDKGNQYTAFIKNLEKGVYIGEILLENDEKQSLILTITQVRKLDKHIIFAFNLKMNYMLKIKQRTGRIDLKTGAIWFNSDAHLTARELELLEKIGSAQLSRNIIFKTVITAKNKKWEVIEN